MSVFAAAASAPEANERNSSLISRRLHYRGLQSLFLLNARNCGMDDLGCAENHVLCYHFEWKTKEDVYLGSLGKDSFIVLFISVPTENIHFGSVLWSL